MIGIVWREPAPAAPPFRCSQPGYPAPHYHTSRIGILQAQCGKSVLLQLRPSAALSQATLHQIITHKEQAYYRQSVARACSCSSALLLLSARLPCTTFTHIKNRHIIGIVWQEHAPAAPPFCCSQTSYPAPHLHTSRIRIMWQIPFGNSQTNLLNYFFYILSCFFRIAVHRQFLLFDIQYLCTS